jgi:hypothetical protein
MNIIMNRRRNWYIGGQRDSCRGGFGMLGYWLFGRRLLSPAQEVINKVISIMNQALYQKMITWILVG